LSGFEAIALRSRRDRYPAGEQEATALPYISETRNRISSKPGTIRMADYLSVLEEAFIKYNGQYLLDRLKAEGTEFLSLQSREIEASYMFIDIKGFTQLSAQIIDGSMMDDLNRYFHGMSEVIQRNNGYIDSFIGDAIFAFFGLTGKHHADDTCTAALECLETLKSVNQMIQTDTELQVGIGISTGKSLIGNIGSDRKLKFTAMGDEVNMASRMESLTGSYGTPIIISGKTASRLTRDYPTTKLDTVSVKGLAGETDIYALLPGE
jgi:adenylate cyclase